MLDSDQMSMPTLTGHEVITRVNDIAALLTHDLKQELEHNSDGPLSLGDLDAVHAVIEASLYDLYALLNTLAPTGWVDPRVQSRADARALKALQDHAASTARDVKLYLDGRATR